LDTPGFHLSERKMNQELKRVALMSLEEVDLVLYVVDPTREPAEEEEMIAQAVAAAPQPKIIAINKMDLLAAELDPAAELNPAADPDPAADLNPGAGESATGSAIPASWQAFLEDRFPGVPAASVSAASGAGLDTLSAALFEAAPEGEPFYPEEYYTDQDPSFRISETIREQVIRRTSQEVPHAVYVDVVDARFQRAKSPGRSGGGVTPAAETEADVPPQRLAVRAIIYVERESQKGIVVGRGGAMIRDIRTGSEQTLRELFPYSVALDLRVKVNPRWRKKEAVLRRLLR
jgi:GTP-binding protein Era